MKKIALITLGIFLSISLFILYYTDRIITSFLFWIEIIPFNVWRVKPTDIETVRKQFPTLSLESINQLVIDRKKSIRFVTQSLYRVALYFVIFVLYLVIF